MCVSMCVCVFLSAKELLIVHWQIERGTDYACVVLAGKILYPVAIQQRKKQVESELDMGVA